MHDAVHVVGSELTFPPIRRIAATGWDITQGHLDGKGAELEDRVELSQHRSIYIQRAQTVVSHAHIKQRIHPGVRIPVGHRNLLREFPNKRPGTRTEAENQVTRGYAPI